MYEPVIGLEVHVELNTKSKMFCRTSTDYFGQKPNTCTCPICLGLPGTLPYINQEAIISCVKIGLALNCSVNEKSLFERKNYFYPDLPKGYQVSQYRWPLCLSGQLQMEKGQVIRINRVHQEEDTGKLSHADSETLIDFNRSGVPLVEIVTEPDFHDSETVREFAKKLQQIFRYLGVSNADMDRGDMRLEANVSVRPVGQKELPNYRIELKNINSFRFMVAAIEYEKNRQIKALENGEKLVQETRGWDQEKNQTFLQRVKEEANDYRYFPDPDLPPLNLTGQEVLQIKQSLPELPGAKMQRFIDSFGLSKAQAAVLTFDNHLADFFETAKQIGEVKGVDAQKIANYIINQKVNLVKVRAEDVIEGVLGKARGIVSDEESLENFAKEAIAQNPVLVEAYKRGKTTVIQALVGVVMRQTSGKADAIKTLEVFAKLLK